MAKPTRWPSPSRHTPVIVKATARRSITEDSLGMVEATQNEQPSTPPLCAVHLERGLCVAANIAGRVKPYRGDPVLF